MTDRSTETVHLTDDEREALDAVLVALWQCETESGYEFTRRKVEALFEQTIAARLGSIYIDLSARIAGCRTMGGDYGTAFADGLESARSHLFYPPEGTSDAQA